MTTGTGNTGEWLPHGASLQGHQSSTHIHTHTHTQQSQREMWMSSNYRPEPPKMITFFGLFSSETSNKSYKTKLKEKCMHILKCVVGHNREYADLFAMCDSGRMIMCRQALANWSISVRDLGPGLWWLQLLMPGGAAETWLNLQVSPITQSHHSYLNYFPSEWR